MLFHITQQAAWQTAQAAGLYQTAALKMAAEKVQATERFIHLAQADQVIGVAERFYQGNRIWCCWALSPLA